MAYTINSELGDSIYKNLGQNETYSAKDGSTWYRDQNGQMMVKTADGRTLQAQNNYQSQQTAQPAQSSVYAQPSTYNINSAAGNNYYKSLGMADTYSAKDGSTWYRDQNGQLMVRNAAGDTLAAQNNYTYANEPNTYAIGSQLGYDVYRNLPVGVAKSGFADGSTWVKQADGSVIVTTADGQQKIGVITYDPGNYTQQEYGGAYGVYGGTPGEVRTSDYGSVPASVPVSSLTRNAGNTPNIVGSNPGTVGSDPASESPTVGETPAAETAGAGNPYGQYGIPQAQDQSQFIKDAYGANLEATNAGLQSSYEKNLSAIDAEESGLGQNYYELQRQAQAQSDLQKNAYNEYANASGLNSGTRGQAALSQSNNLATQLNNIRMSETEKRAELERQRTLLGQQYQSAIQQAQSQNDMQLAQALYEEAVRVDKSIIDAAKRDADVALQMFATANDNQRAAASALASGADNYSAYANLYGVNDTIANQIRNASARTGRLGGSGSYSGVYSSSSSGSATPTATNMADGVDYAKIYSDFMSSGAASLKEFILDNYKDYGINGSNRYAAANNVQAFVDGGGMQVGKNANGGYDFKAGSGYSSLLNPTQTYTNPSPSAGGGGTTVIYGSNGNNYTVSDEEAAQMLANGTGVLAGKLSDGTAIVRLAGAGRTT